MVHIQFPVIRRSNNWNPSPRNAVALEAVEQVTEYGHPVSTAASAMHARAALQVAWIYKGQLGSPLGPTRFEYQGHRPPPAAPGPACWYRRFKWRGYRAVVFFSAPIRDDIVNAPNASVAVISAARRYLSNGLPVVPNSDGTADGMQKVSDVSTEPTGAFGAPYPDVMLHAHPVNQGSLEVVAPSPWAESTTTTDRNP